MKFIFSKKKTIIIIIVISLISAYFIFSKKSNVEYTTAKVEKGTLLQTVSETGSIKSTQNIDLNFLNTGKIASIPVKVGDKVKQGQILAELDYSGLTIRQKQAQASLSVARANLDKLLAGATQAELAVSQAGVEQARTSYVSAQNDLEKVTNIAKENVAQAQKSLDDFNGGVTTYDQALKTANTNLGNTIATYQRGIDNSIANALITADSKLTVANTAIDSINTILNDNNAKDYFSVKNLNFSVNTKSTVVLAHNLIGAAEISLAAAKLNKTKGNVDKVLNDTLSALNKTFEALNYCYGALENSVTSSSFSQTSLDAYKTSISGQQTAVSTGISSTQTALHTLDDAILAYNTNVSNAQKSQEQAQANLNTAFQNAKNALSSAKLNMSQQISTAQARIDSAYKAWQVAKAQFNQLDSPARTQDVRLYQAQVDQAQAEVDSIQNQINNSIIKAPIDGIITKLNYEIGEDTVVGKAVFSMLVDNNFYIEADVSESDINKVKLENPAIITLDAFGEDIKFSGSVFFIDPGETVIQGVVYYIVKINLDSNSVASLNQYGDKIKPGMTANITITTAQRDGVLIAPDRAIIDKDGAKYARKLEKKNLVEVPVSLGLMGDEGMVEVYSGLKEGDNVVTYIKNNNK